MILGEVYYCTKSDKVVCIVSEVHMCRIQYGMHAFENARYIKVAVFAQLTRTERKGHLQNTKHTTLALNCFVQCTWSVFFYINNQCFFHKYVGGGGEIQPPKI